MLVGVKKYIDHSNRFGLLLGSRSNGSAGNLTNSNPKEVLT